MPHDIYAFLQNSTSLVSSALNVVSYGAVLLLQFHALQVQTTTVNRLCNKRVIVTVNGQFPGPNINVSEGDTVVVHLLNEGPYNITIHW